MRMSKGSEFQIISVRHMRHACLLVSAAALFLLAFCSAVRAETSAGLSAQPALANLPDAPQSQLGSPSNADPTGNQQITLRDTPVRILKDQAGIWTSPVRLRERDYAVLVSLGLAATLTATADHEVMSSSKLQNISLNNHAVTASNGLLGGFVAAPVLIYGLGYIHHDSHATETGILGGEAMANGLVVEEAMKLVSMRERPTVDNAKGKFFQSSVGLDSSFPSNHCVLAWSSAAVIASEYPGPLTQIAAYGLATGVSVARVLGRQHFPSDVLVGSAVGWLVGRYVFHRHSKERVEGE